MAEWLFERGIGEDRAALVEDGSILEAAIELPGRLRVGAVLAGRLASILGRRGIVALDRGGEALLEPLPAKLTEGCKLNVEIVREALAEAGREKLPRCRVSDAAERDGPDLEQRLRAGGIPVAAAGAGGIDRLEEAGWSELLEEALTGEIAFPGGALRMSLTPAMTLFDVDGALPPAALAVAGAQAAGRAIRRLGVGGSIGIDLPTLARRDERQAAAAALDAVLAPPFERTAVNGFGFLQVVRRRERPSLAELLQGDPAGAAARALLRRSERSSGAGVRTLHVHPAVAARLRQNPEWLETLERRLGAAVALQVEPALAISAGHVHSQFA
ncbi:MAG TPA: ribonuclease [Allosphingosinicella sp.]